MEAQPGQFRLTAMSNENNSNNSGWSHLVALFSGLVFATWASRKELEDSKKSRAELDYPDDAEAAFTEISELLDAWEADRKCETEDDFTQDLAQYLDENSELEVEVYPNTPEGNPDILIGDLIALELKIRPNKNERNRCIGQCAHYSRLWITWMVIVDSPPSKVGRLREVLEDKGLEHILVFDFS